MNNPIVAIGDGSVYKPWRTVQREVLTVAWSPEAVTLHVSPLVECALHGNLRVSVVILTMSCHAHGKLIIV